MKILVTGAAGFIGSQLCEVLLARGDQVVGIDNFDLFYSTDLKKENLGHLLRFPSFKFVEASITRDLDECPSVGGEFDAIIHLAAKAGVRPSLEDPEGYYETNVIGTLKLLEFAKKNKIRKFVFASSSSVYGENPKRPWKECDSDLMPISPYASSKLAGEHLGHVYSLHQGIEFVGLRFFTVYGPRQRPDLAIRKFVELIESGTPIPVYGDGETTRDYTFVSDTVNGIVLALDASNLGFYEIINLGRGDSIRLTDMISTISQVLGKEALVQRLPSQSGDVNHTQACIEKAKTLLGYQPKVSFQEGVESLLEWEKNRNWL